VEGREAVEAEAGLLLPNRRAEAALHLLLIPPPLLGCVFWLWWCFSSPSPSSIPSPLPTPPPASASHRRPMHVTRDSERTERSATLIAVKSISDACNQMWRTPESGGRVGAEAEEEGAEALNAAADAGAEAEAEVEAEAEAECNAEVPGGVGSEGSEGDTATEVKGGSADDGCDSSTADLLALLSPVAVRAKPMRPNGRALRLLASNGCGNASLLSAAELDAEEEEEGTEGAEAEAEGGTSAGVSASERTAFMSVGFWE
jgi:hypothetical protein